MPFGIVLVLSFVAAADDPTNVPNQPHECAHARSFSFDLSGRRLACLNQRNELLFWNGAVDKPEVLALEKVPDAKWPGNMPMGCAIDAEGRNALIAYFDGRVQVWDLERKAKTRDLETTRKNLEFCKLSPDGKRIGTLGGSSKDEPDDKKSMVVLWNTRDWSPETPIAFPDPINDYSFSPDGRQVFLCVGYPTDQKEKGFTGIVAIDTESKREVGRIAYGTGFPIRIAVSPDGRWIATGGGDAVPAGPDSRSLSGHLRIFDWQDKKFLAEPYRLQTDYVRCVQFSVDGKLLYSGSYSSPPGRGGEISELKAHAVSDWTQQWVATLGSNNPHEMAVSPLGSTVLAAEYDSLVVLDAKEGKVLGKKLKYRFYPEDQPKPNVDDKGSVNQQAASHRPVAQSGLARTGSIPHVGMVDPGGRAAAARHLPVRGRLDS